MAGDFYCQGKGMLSSLGDGRNSTWFCSGWLVTEILVLVDPVAKILSWSFTF